MKLVVRFFILLCFFFQTLAAETVVIFGATGDLTIRKLIPALEQLQKERQDLRVIGFARRELSDEAFRQHVKANSALNLSYVSSNFTDDQGYIKLKKTLEGPCIYYLATHPSAFPVIIQKLGKHGLAQGHKIIIEKPFGTNLASAEALQKILSETFAEEHTFRMDHYLGKPALLDFQKMPFDWSKADIEQVQITLSETLGIGTRGQLWEETGTLRDVFQNHILQMLAIVTHEKLESARLANMIRAQYTTGMIDNQPVVGYKEEEGVKANSLAETYIAAELYVDTPRWQDVPFYVKAGKRLPVQTVQIAICFKNKDILFVRVQPKAGIFWKRSNGSVETVLESVGPDAYVRLLSDCIKGDTSLYVQGEEQMAAWRLLAPILETWQQQSAALYTYEAGTFGPFNDEELKWHLLLD